MNNMKTLAGVCAVSWLGVPMVLGGLIVTAPTGEIALRTEAGGQKAKIYLENRGDTSAPVVAGTFYFGITPVPGASSQDRPTIASVRMLDIEGSPLTSTLLSQYQVRGPRGDVMVGLEGASLSVASPLVIAAGSKWPVAEIEFDTTGVPAGPTTFRLMVEARTADGAEFDMASFFNTLSPTDPGDILEIPVSQEAILVKVGGGAVDGSPKVGFRMDPTGGGMVFEVDATGADAPRMEYSDDLASGTWRAVTVQPTRAGSRWQWGVPIDAGTAARFFRMATGTTGVGSGHGSSR